MALDILALTNEIVGEPIETVKFVGSPMDSIRAVAIVDKKGDGHYLLKTIKPNPVQCSTIYVFGNGRFYTFEAKQNKQGYVVSLPDGYKEFPPAEELIGLHISRERVYNAYRKEDLPEHCMIRLQELEIRSMKALMEESTPDQLKSLLEMADEEEDETSPEAGLEELVIVDDEEIEDTINKLDSDDVDPEAVMKGLELIQNNFELARFTLSQTTTKRESVEAYFNMKPGLLIDMPVSIVSSIDTALNAALNRAEHEEAMALLLDAAKEEDEGDDDLGN